jgi:hypothetical protein
MATIKELSDGGPDGTRLGQSSTDLVAFHGASPSARASIASVATAATVATAVAGIQAILTALSNKGLITIT